MGGFHDKVCSLCGAWGSGDVRLFVLDVGLRPIGGPAAERFNVRGGARVFCKSCLENLVKLEVPEFVFDRLRAFANE